MKIHVPATTRLCGWAISFVMTSSASADDLAVHLEASPPLLMLANVYNENEVDLKEYWVSEKYDGIRAYWNGTRLLTRAGNVIRTPEWFVAGWPTQALDGELWIDRRQFETLLATVRDEIPDDLAWRRVRYMVFDLPSDGTSFNSRRLALANLVASVNQRWLQPVQHWRVEHQNVLQSQLDEIVTAGGEGLMLHRDGSFYHSRRSDDLLKVKQYEDAEAKVIGHVPGKGKYQGLLGALEVQRPDGLTFRIGTGLSDEERRHPPSVGIWLTYRYYGTTQHGVPKFATFVRVRENL